MGGFVGTTPVFFSAGLDMVSELVDLGKWSERYVILCLQSL